MPAMKACQPMLTYLTPPQSHCGSGLARESGVSVNINVCWADVFAGKPPPLIFVAMSIAFALPSIVDRFLLPLGVGIDDFQALGQLVDFVLGRLAVGQHCGVGARQLGLQQLQLGAVEHRLRLFTQVLHAALERQACLAGLLKNSMCSSTRI